jgi:hypothetical protein
MQGDPSTCGYIHSELQFEALEAKKVVQAGKDEADHCCTQLKAELVEVKQTLDSVVAELWKLRMQRVEHTPEQKPEKTLEQKPEFDARKLCARFISFSACVCRSPDWCSFSSNVEVNMKFHLVVGS